MAAHRRRRSLARCRSFIDGPTGVRPSHPSGLNSSRCVTSTVQGLIVVSLIDGKANARETVAVEQFARALEVDAPEVRDLRYLFNGEMLRLRLDLARRFWLREKVKESGRRNVSEASASSCAAPITGARTGFFDPAKGDDRHPARSNHERRSKQRMELLAGHGRTSRRTQKALQHPCHRSLSLNQAAAPIGRIRSMTIEAVPTLRHLPNKRRISLGTSTKSCNCVGNSLARFYSYGNRSYRKPGTNVAVALS